MSVPLQFLADEDFRRKILPRFAIYLSDAPRREGANFDPHLLRQGIPRIRSGRMTIPRLYADFHNLDDLNRLRLTAAGTLRDLERQGIQLHEGLLLTSE